MSLHGAPPTRPLYLLKLSLPRFPSGNFSAHFHTRVPTLIQQDFSLETNAQGN